LTEAFNTTRFHPTPAFCRNKKMALTDKHARNIFTATYTLQDKQY